MGWSHGRRVVSHEPSSHRLWATAPGFDRSLLCLLSSTGAVWVVLLRAGCPGLSRSSGAVSQGGGCAATEADASVESASAKWLSPAHTTVRSASATTGCVRPTTGRSAQVRKPLWWQKLRKLRVYIISGRMLGTQHTDIVVTVMYVSLNHDSKGDYCGHIQGFHQIKGYKSKALAVPENGTLPTASFICSRGKSRSCFGLEALQAAFWLLIQDTLLLTFFI